jgi:hypothetical protein
MSLAPSDILCSGAACYVVARRLSRHGVSVARLRHLGALSLWLLHPVGVFPSRLQMRGHATVGKRGVSKPSKIRMIDKVSLQLQYSAKGHRQRQGPDTLHAGCVLVRVRARLLCFWRGQGFPANG